MPDFLIERALGGVIAGIDESGRGPWAGPVFAAAVILEARRLPRMLRYGLNDSKKLSASRRRELFDALKPHARIGVGQASVEEIDAIIILQASMLAMRPILMTSVATALGAVLLALATGPGAENRHVIGIVVIDGITLATLLTLFMVPVFYILLARYARPAGVIARRIEQQEEEHSQADRTKNDRRAEDETGTKAEAD